MRATLEQLKAMNDDELSSHWLSGEFPFDVATGCRICLTQHTYTLHRPCKDERHRKFIEQLHTRLGENFALSEKSGHLRKYLEELYALRLFYDSLYPPSEPVSLPSAEDLDAVAQEQCIAEATS